MGSSESDSSVTTHTGTNTGAEGVCVVKQHILPRVCKKLRNGKIIMKKKICSLALAVILIIVMAVPAAAARVTWSDGNGYHTALVSNIYSTTAVYNAMLSGIYEFSGGRVMEMIGDGILNRTHNYTFRLTSGSAYYKSYVTQAMSREAMLTTYTINRTYDDYTVTIPADYAPGYYCIGVKFYCKNADWSVSGQEVDASVRAVPMDYSGTGTITKAPTGQYTLYAMLRDDIEP